MGRRDTPQDYRNARRMLAVILHPVAHTYRYPPDAIVGPVGAACYQ
jgi:hypothetical protein